MCTIALALQSWPDFPVVVAATHDGPIDRPTTGPLLWERAIPVLAPRDDLAGGTWLGVNARGLFASITNGARRDIARHSRGQLVLRALEQTTAIDAHRALATIRPADFAGFHLIYADGTQAGITSSDGTQLKQELLGPGLHVIAEDSHGTLDARRAQEVRASWPRTPGPLLSQLRPVLSRHHTLARWHSTCVHPGLSHYGTRSSVILGLGPQVEASTFLWADGLPCAAAYVPQSALVEQLGGATGRPDALPGIAPAEPPDRRARRPGARELATGSTGR